MAESGSRTSVVVIGPADLATTAIAIAVEAHRIPAAQALDPTQWRPTDDPPGIALVDVSARSDAMQRVGQALAAGWRVVVLGDDGRSARVAAAIAAGADGWISTTVPLATLVAALRELHAGRAITLAQDRTEWLKQHRENVAESDKRTRQLDLLTDREFAVLRALERGLRAAAIAQSNVVALTTVRTQIRSILRKLEVNSQDAAVALYRTAVQARTDR